jgi:branched-subunit amino acid ABC-type transport system permease component
LGISLLINQFFSGLSTAAVLFLMAVGLTMIFGILRVLNLAHGSFYLFGAFICCSIVSLTSNFWLGLIVAPILVALLGGVTEVVLFRRVYALPHAYQILLSFGLIYIFSDLMKIIWGGRPYFSLRPSILYGGIPIGDQTLSYYSLFTIGIALVVGLLIWTLLHKTRLGNLIRAVEQDREASATLGIDAVNLSTLTFMIAAWVAGLGGAVSSGFTVAVLGLDVEVLISAFVVVVVGGMGSLIGSAIAAVIVGLVSAFGVLFIPQFATALMFIILVMVLIFRPWGLLGERLE